MESRLLKIVAIIAGGCHSGSFMVVADSGKRVWTRPSSLLYFRFIISSPDAVNLQMTWDLAIWEISNSRWSRTFMVNFMPVRPTTRLPRLALESRRKIFAVCGIWFPICGVCFPVRGICLWFALFRVDVRTWCLLVKPEVSREVFRSHDCHISGFGTVGLKQAENHGDIQEAVKLVECNWNSLCLLFKPPWES
jgi:hypothetical protein